MSFYYFLILTQLIVAGLVLEDESKFYLTKQGWYWYTNIMFWLMPEKEQISLKKFITKQLSIPGKFIAKKELLYV